ncbi:phage major capsid protein [Mesorhizobium sp. M3A.F.Ca.ET.201.01.1.1]|uniref:phage major capsid protein n=1 Tax=Mesorhizobium sp. M3A.F.Ca.ET.201.01.1.1 TaxID=2563946 RepID=UPI001093FFC5|nr:phage major capsid protein [Mesorhizobium sp. M3A.F.Ca.ET.201.01.1.1]TGS70396.1 phage major capsid protein [Mesorhizobium sp. M3A.F.Ca.ET.201.01.1.1]
MDLDELKTAFDGYHGEVKTLVGGQKKLELDVKKMGDKVDNIETALARIPSGGFNPAGAKASDEMKAFGSYISYGEQRMPQDEVKSLIVGEDTRGGYLAPSEFVADVIKGVVQFSPVRQAARVGSTSSKSVMLPVRTGAPTAQWVTETQTRPETSPTYGQKEILVYEASCYVDISQQLVEDAAVDMNSELAFDVAQEFGRLEGAAFVTGDGVNKPAGFMSESTIGFSVSGSAATIADANGQANGLIDLMYSLAPFYRNRSTWMMNGTTLAAVRKLKDGQNNYIWQPALAVGQPETILSRPVVEAVDMPSQGAGLYPIALGDFESAYRIYDRVSLSLLRDPYSQATSGLIRFHARRRVGGSTVLPEAIKKLKCST